MHKRVAVLFIILPVIVIALTLREAAITVWCDDETPFGYTLLEALRSGTLVFAKIPDEPTEWMLDEDGGLTKSIIWFDTVDTLTEMLPAAVRSWTNFEVSDKIYEAQKNFDDLYSEQTQEAEIEHVYIKTIVERRLNEFKEILAELNENKDEENE